MTTKRPAPEWTGRDDGPGIEHARWHNTIKPWHKGATAGQAILGFASDEGVRRNQGRVGAYAGPEALRKALASVALQQPLDLYDAGDIEVNDGDLEAGQDLFAEVLSELLKEGHFTLGLGGGHEITFASYDGLTRALTAEDPEGQWSLGLLNIDAHFDLREETRATSGTGFSQIAVAEREAGREFHYAVVGISEAANTRILFQRAEELGVRVVLDTECSVTQLDRVDTFVADFCSGVDHLYLTIDLDALPAAIAPGVSAPAGFGIGLEVVHTVVTAAIRSGKLRHADIAELNPTFDIDMRTARTAARLATDLIEKRA